MNVPESRVLDRTPYRSFSVQGMLGMLLLAATTVHAAPVTFVDVAATAGVGKSTESYGASWGDVNGDGYLDLFVSNHRLQPSLYLNRGNGTFSDVGKQIKTWVNHVNADTHGGAFADYDNDGDQDLLITTGTGNPSQFFVNEQGAMIDHTTDLGVDFPSVGGRLPVWFDYNGDGLIDYVLTQFGGAARVFRQTPTGFVETTSKVGMVCLQFHFGMLLDVNDDGRLDFLCPGNESDNVFPQKIYNTYPFPWQNITSLFPGIQTVPDAVIADFNNDGRMDVFALSNTQLRPSNVVLSSPNIIEANLSGGEKGFNFVSNGQVTVSLDWNRIDEGNGLVKILIGNSQINPSQVPFTLDPADPSVWGVPPPNPALAPVMRIGFDPGTGRWTVIAEAGTLFSEAYYVVTTTVPVSDLQSTGLWTGDLTGSSTLMMNLPGGFSDQTAAAGLGTPIQCGSVTAGDFDNDMDVDLYLTCRSGVENLSNIYLDNQGNGTFVTVPGAGGATGPLGSNVTSGAGTADTAVAADYDLDGFLDVFSPNGFGLRPLYYGGPGSLFRNQGNGNHWIELDLVGTQGTRDPVGAVVTAVANNVSQFRVYNGSYHRWAQDPTRMHFGLAGATTVDLTVKWPNGATEMFSAVPVNYLYRIKQGEGQIQAVTPGAGSPYPCGTPSYAAGADRGVFIWRDCVNDRWQFRFAPGGVATSYVGNVRSVTTFPSVTPVSLESGDVLDTTTDPKRIAFQFATANANEDGFTLVLNENSHTCFRVDSPVGIPVRYGPFKTPMTGDFDIQTGGACAVNQPEISAADVGAAENSGTIDFVLALSSAATQPVSVNVSTTGVTATQNVDFTGIGTTTVEFAVGETQKHVTVQLLDDQLAEDGETFLLMLSNPVGVSIATLQAIGTILDDEISACGGLPAYNAATETGIFMGKSCLGGGWQIRVTAGGSAITKYHEGTLVSSTGFTEVTPFSIESSDILDSTSDALSLHFKLAVTGSNVDGMDVQPVYGSATCFNLATGGPVLVGPSRILVIPPFDLDTLGPCSAIPQVSVSPASASENAGSVNVTVALSVPTTGVVSVDVQTVDGTALAGHDYVTLAPTTLVFNPGETSKTVTVQLSDDAVSEGPETFAVRLGNISGATQGVIEAAVTIQDDEVSACGAPSIDGNAETGVFIWRQCGTDNWSMRVSGGGVSAHFVGSIVSAAPFQQVTGYNLETSDILDFTSAPQQISYTMDVSGGTLDGADFSRSPGASTCFRTEQPAGVTVHVGAAKTAVTAPFDIETLGACSGLPTTLSVSTPSTGEAAGTAVITVSLSEVSAVDVSANIEVINGTATVNADFLGLPATSVMIPAGALSATLNLPIIDDVLAEGDEQLTVRLSNPVNTVFATGQSTLTITDDELSPCGTPTINPATEPGVFLWKDCSTGQWAMRVNGGGATNTRTYSGSIVSSTQFSQISGFSIEGSDVLNYVSNPSVAQWTLNVTGSGQDGVDFRPATISETCFNVVLPVGTTVAVGPAKTAIAPPFDLNTLGACGAAPQLSIHDVSVAESAQASFTVTMTKPAIASVAVDYASSDGTAVAPGDYTAVASTLAIPAGSLTAYVTVNIVDDGEIEATESFSLQLSNPVGVSISDGTATGSIVDNDAAGLSVDDVVAGETDASLSFTVSLSTASLDPVTVDVMTVDVEAIAGTDFAAVPLTTLTFAPGEIGKTVVVTLSDDSDIEGFETFRLELSNATGAGIVRAAGVATINDDEPAPVVSIAGATADENAGPLVFNVTLSAPSTQPVSVEYSSADGTAVAGVDYAGLAPGTLVFAPGEVLKTLPVSLIDDVAIEADETLAVSLANPVRASAGAMNATGTIVDDEGESTLTVANVTAAENSGSLVFTAVLSAPSSHVITVNYATVNGTATAPADFTAGSGTLTFQAGTTSRTVAVPLINDLLVEQGNETFSLTLSNPVNVVLGTTSATATITDDDALVCGAPAYNAATEAVVAVWLDCATGTWSVRATAGGKTFQAYTGSVSSNQGLSNIVGVNLEASDLLEYGTNPTKLNFRMQMSPPGYDGFSFQLSSDATACFTTGLPNGAIAIVGANRIAVGGSFDLRTLGPCQTLPVLSAGSVSVVENAGVASFPLTLSSPSSLPVSVDYRTMDGLAVGGSDFVVTGPATLTFQPGETSKNIDVVLLNDSEVELVENFTLQLGHIVNGSFGAAAIAQSVSAAITDDEIPLVVNVSDLTVSETGGSVAFAVNLSTTSVSETRVTVATANGTAVAGLDYVAVAPVELVFAPGQTSKQVTLTLLDDALAEGPESFQVQLSNAVGAGLGTALATVSVTDNEPSPCGDPGYNAATETGLFIWKNCTSGVWSARFVAASGFTLYTGTVVSSLPLSSVVPVSIESTGDVLNSTTNPSQISYSLSVGKGNMDGFDFQPQAGSGTCVNISSPTGRPVYVGAARMLVGVPFSLATLQGCSLTPPVLSAANITVAENGGSASFQLTLSQASYMPVSVDYVTVDGSALAGSDYMAVGLATLTFQPGETSRSVVVPLLDDAVIEGQESFSLQLGNLVNASFSGGGATRTVAGTITDNDIATTFDVGDLTVSEAAGTVNVAVTLSVAAAGETRVTVATVDGTATDGTDYVAVGPVELVFAPGETSKQVTVTLLDDAISEGTETLTVQLSNAIGATIGTGSATVSITDNEPAPSFAVTGFTVAETAGTVDVAVTLNVGMATETRVTVATANGTAQSGVDYEAVGPVELVFAPGEMSKQVTLTLLDDVLAEGPENLTVQLSNPVGAAIGTGTGTVTLTDNEPSPCGDPGYNAATENGLFIWKNCTSGLWSARLVAASGYTVYTGSVVSSLPLSSVAGFSIEGTDTFTTTNPLQISYVLKVGVGNVDGFDFLPQAGSGSCVNMTSSPAGRLVYVGAARTLRSAPFSLETLQACP